MTGTHHSQPDADPVAVLDTQAAGPAVIRGGAIRALGFAAGVPWAWVAVLAAALAVAWCVVVVDLGLAAGALVWAQAKDETMQTREASFLIGLDSPR